MLARWRTINVTPRMLAAAAHTPPSLLLRTSRSLSTVAARDVLAYNSLSGALEPLPRAQAVTPHVLKWYACGPTVYDRAHLGHARAYVSQDILRRILEKKFGYNVFLVMGVTDVDDKIIKRANERGIDFATLARNEERAFIADMAALNVAPPTAITRVSEHMDEIVAYVAQIEANGFAYAARDGSGVYFHTQQLGDAYGKLDPARNAHVARTDVQLSDLDLEPEPESIDDLQTKRDRRDFALWKATKAPDEPAWDSPWGRGRPGWHIECSAMTHHVLGARLDVHTGGIDLKFPHHNNEIAQCEAHSNSSRDGGACCHPMLHSIARESDSVDTNIGIKTDTNIDTNKSDWCRHFLHFGHLYIAGLKMSKSLKNFVSIQDFLATHSADHFRLFCLQFKYRANLHYAPDRIRDAAALADRFKSFFRSVQAYATERSYGSPVSTKKCESADLELLRVLFETKASVDAALGDDFDTPRALALVLELVTRCNAYLLVRPDGPTEVLLAVTQYVLDVLELFGLEGLHREFAHVSQLVGRSADSDDAAALGDLSAAAAPTGTDALGTNGEAILQALVRFRAAVREAALRDPQASHNREILALCDVVRNDELSQLGVHVEDLAPGRSIFKLRSKDEHEAALAAARDADAVTATLQRKQRELDALMQIAPANLFRDAPEFADQFAAFDADGVPTVDAATRKPLSKSQHKKLRKRLEKHTKSYEKYWQSKQLPH